MIGPEKLSSCLTLNQVPKHRHFGCSSYQKCLDYAAEEKWVSFSCRSCERFEENKGIPLKNYIDDIAIRVATLCVLFSFLFSLLKIEKLIFNKM